MSLPQWMHRFVVLDVETTGLHAHEDRITELGLALYEHGRFTERRDYFINPEGRRVSERITEITGITQADLDDAPPFWHVWNEIAPLLYEATPVAYNASFDRGFIGAAVARSWPRAAFGQLPWLLEPSRPWVDALALSRLAFYDRMREQQPHGYLSFKLTDVGRFCGFDVTQAHRADFDALLTGSILLAVKREVEVDWSWEATLERQRYASFLHEYRSYIRKAGDPPVKFEAFECDACHKVKRGVLDGKGWTLPAGWYINPDPSGRPRVVCGSTCDLIARWGDGQ